MHSTVISSRILPDTRAVTAGLVVGFALATALAAQISIPLPFTPVPITGQTFAVLLAGAAGGAMIGGASQLLYVLLGGFGLPFYADGGSGWDVIAGPTGGYLIGFVAAAWFVGFLAQRRQDRSVVTAIPAFLAGTVIIYLCGVTWLMIDLGVSGTAALELGLVPFVVGDLFKASLAGALLPTAWKLADK